MWYTRTGTIPKLEMHPFLRMQKPDQLPFLQKKAEDFLNLSEKICNCETYAAIHFSFEL